MSEVGARAGAGQAPLRPSSTVLAQNVGQWTPYKIWEDSAQLPPPGLWCMDQSPPHPGPGQQEVCQGDRRSAPGTGGSQGPSGGRGCRGEKIKRNQSTGTGQVLGG